jgi:hypothetical protein
MRRNIVVLGILMMFSALIFLAASQLTTELEPSHDTWVNVNDKEANPPLPTLSMEANLTAGDKFRVFFALQQSNNYLPDGVGIALNVSEPYSEHVISYGLHADIDEYGKIVIAEPNPYPPIMANYTGTYRVGARSFAVFLIRLLIIQKLKHIDARLDYPYWYFSPMSIAVFLGGVVVLLWGTRGKSKRSRKSR